jgi:hypothetical protein
VFLDPSGTRYQNDLSHYARCHYCGIVGTGFAFVYDPADYELAWYAQHVDENKVKALGKWLMGHSDIHESLHSLFLWPLNVQICLLEAKGYQLFSLNGQI